MLKVVRHPPYQGGIKGGSPAYRHPPYQGGRGDRTQNLSSI
ncbi:hypothetical protein VL20_3640 [Microcystis panniformis FACHB-1757]|uniref:Uncharacterized protein n=1 Tax=Microcystis panniformis FACHB-1757 TaxID=1638788 RepID=A0A0K1S3T9_9CHRO|nr:hypothetical protein VL20_3640 [Microcystis panniformis FACHB-1757]